MHPQLRLLLFSGLLSLLQVGPLVRAQWQPGDILFTAFDADGGPNEGSDQIAFVTLVPIPGQTSIYITDKEWNGTAFTSGETELTWLAPAEGVAPGTVVVIDATALTANVGTVQGSKLDFNQTAEAVYAYLGTSLAPTTFLTALNTGDHTALLDNTGLSNGVNAIFNLRKDADIALYIGPRSGLNSWAEYKALLLNTADPAIWKQADSQGVQTLIDPTPFSLLEPPPPPLGTLTLALPQTPFAIPEDAGTFTITLTLSPAPAADLSVSLASSDPSEATVPSPLLIAAGQTTTSITVQLQTDGLDDGDQPLTLTANAPGYSDAAANFTVTDVDEPPPPGADLQPGDILFCAIDALGGTNEGNKQLAFVPLVPIPANTLIYFCDKEWTGSAFTTGESEISWLAPTGGVLPGTVIVIQTNVPSVNLGRLGSASTKLDLSGSGESVYAYQGQSLTPSRFLTALNTGDATALLDNTGLTDGQNAIFSLRSNTKFAQFIGTRSQLRTWEEYRAALLSTANPEFWVTTSSTGTDHIIDTTPFTLYMPPPLGSFTLALPQTPFAILENTGIFILTASLSPIPASTITLLLESNDPTEATVAATVNVAAGQSLISIPVNVLADRVKDGNQTVTLTVAAPQYAPATVSFTVVDVDSDPALSLTLEPRRVPESAGPGAALGTLTLNTPAPDGGLVAQLEAVPADAVRLPLSVFIPAGLLQASFAIEAVWDMYSTAERIVTISASAPGYLRSQDTLTLSHVPPPLTLSLPKGSQVLESDPALLTLQVAIPSPLSTPLEVFLQVDTAGLSLPGSLIIPAGSTETAVDFSVNTDVLGSRNRQFTITASSPQYQSASATVTSVHQPWNFVLEIDRSTFREDAGNTAASLTLTALYAPRELVSLQLSSQPAAILLHPSSLTLGPDGQATRSIPLGVVDDGISTPPRTVTLTVYAGTLQSSQTLTVLDATPVAPSLALQIAPPSFSETLSRAFLTITRNHPKGTVTVSLSSSTDRLSLPASVTLADGEQSAQVAVSPVFDLRDTQTVSGVITASAPGYGSGTVTFQIESIPLPQLALSLKPSSVAENAGAFAALGTVSINQSLPVALTISLSSSDPAELFVPATVTLSAGATAVSFPLAAIPDGFYDEDALITVTAAVDGLASATAAILVTNVDPLPRPVVFLDTPRPSQVFAPGDQVHLNASVSVTEGHIASVNFYVDGKLLETDAAFPYGSSFSPASPGFYELRAEATDSLGRTGISQTVKIEVTAQPDLRPHVVFTSPAPGQEILLGTSVTLAASVQSPYNPVRDLSFYAGGLLLQTIPNAPYTATWTPALPGQYKLTALARTESGYEGTAEEVTLVVVSPDPLADEEDFIRIVYADLFNSAPTDRELRQYLADFAKGTYDRTSFVAHLTTLPLYQDVYQINAAFFIVLGRFPNWSDWYENEVTITIFEVQQNKLSTKDFTFQGYSGALTSVLSLEGKVLARLQTLGGLLARSQEFSRRYGSLGTLSDREFFRILFRNKHGLEPTAQQLLQGQNRIASTDPAFGFNGDRDAFIEAFILDKKFGLKEIIFGPPNQNHRQYSLSASLLAAFWQIEPSVEEAAAFAKLPLLEQIQSIIEHPRFLDRFGRTLFGAWPLADGWKWTPWSGYFYDAQYPWLWQPALGWLWLADRDETNLWTWNPSRGWLWSSTRFAGYYYQDATGTWQSWPY